MIRYRKRLSIKKDGRKDKFFLETDSMQRYELDFCLGRAPIGYWWEQQHQSNLRFEQKEMIKYLKSRLWYDLNPLLVYRNTGEYQQQHDIAVAHAPSESIWVVSTTSDFWIDKGTEVTFQKGVHSFGDVCDFRQRQRLYEAV